MIGIGIIGAGYFGELHAKAIDKVDGVSLVGAVRTTQVELNQFCQQYNCTPYADHLELLRDDRVDAVVVATPHHLHTEPAIACLRAGKSLLLEKPVAITQQDCNLIEKTAEETGVKVMVGFVNRFARCYQTAKEILDSGELGEVICGVSTMSKRWMAPNRRDWHLDAATGGGMWFTAGIHCMERMTWLMNDRIAGVSAQFGTWMHDQSADDVGMVFVRYESHRVGTVVSVGYTQGVPNHLTELTCTKGVMRIEYASGVSVGKNDNWETIPNSGSNQWLPEAVVEEWKQLLPALQGRGEVPVSIEYANHIMAAAFAAQASSRERREIALSVKN